MRRNTIVVGTIAPHIPCVHHGTGIDRPCFVRKSKLTSAHVPCWQRYRDLLEQENTHD